MKLKLFNAEIDITKGRTVYHELRGHFSAIPETAANEFRKAYKNLPDCHQFSANGYDAGAHIIFTAAQVGVDYLIERGHYDLTLELFVEKYLGHYLGWGAAFDEWDEHYSGIIEQGEEMEALRHRRLQNRSRLVGGGFGVAGALKGIALAGAGNAAWGLAHGLRNAVGNASSRAAQQRQLEAFYNDRQNQDFLANAVRDDAAMVPFAVLDFLAQKEGFAKPAFLSDPDLAERAARIKTNLVEGRIPLAKAPDVLPEILEGNPYNTESYVLALLTAGDPDQALEAYGRCHGIDVAALKHQQLLEQVDGLATRAELDPERAAEQVREIAAALGCLDHPDTARVTESIDRMCRTFEEHAYASREEMQTAVAERDRLLAQGDAFGDDLAAERAKLAALKAQAWTYHDAASVFAALEEKIAALDLKQRKFDGHVYASQAEAQQARSDKKAIHAVYVIGSRIGSDLVQEREKLSRLQSGSYVYRQAAEIIAAYEEAIGAEDRKQRTVDGQVYASPAEAAQAREEKMLAARRQAQAAPPPVAAPASGVTAAAANAAANTATSAATNATINAAPAAQPAMAGAPAPTRSLGIGLILGMVFFPLVAPFFTLRKGYSSGARLVALCAFAIGAFVTYDFYLAGQRPASVASATHPAGTAQPTVQPAAFTPPANEDTAGASLPFSGRRTFNFMGGNGTENAISIDAGGQTRVESLGTTGSSVDYEGQFSNPLVLQDGGALLFRDGKVYLMKGDAVETGCMEDGQPCVSDLYGE